MTIKLASCHSPHAHTRRFSANTSPLVRPFGPTFQQPLQFKLLVMDIPSHFFSFYSCSRAFETGLNFAMVLPPGLTRCPRNTLYNRTQTHFSLRFTCEYFKIIRHPHHGQRTSTLHLSFYYLIAPGFSLLYTHVYTAYLYEDVSFSKEVCTTHDFLLIPVIKHQAVQQIVSPSMRLCI